MLLCFAGKASAYCVYNVDAGGAKAEEGIIILHTMAASQERHYLVAGNFTPDFDELDTIFSGKKETDGSITTDNFNYAFAVGASKQYLIAKRLEKGQELYSLYYELQPGDPKNILCKDVKANLCTVILANYIGVNAAPDIIKKASVKKAPPRPAKPGVPVVVQKEPKQEFQITSAFDFPRGMRRCIEGPTGAARGPIEAGEEPYPNGAAGKPVIYLYPKQKQDTSVQLNFEGKIFALYPEYNQQNGWKVTAMPDGTVYQDGKEYSYLFWEGLYDASRRYDWNKGFIVQGGDARNFLREKLSEIGLTPKEYNEFIVYWYPKMQDNEYNLVHFATSEEYDKYAELKIEPNPDNILRVFMVYKKIPKSKVKKIAKTLKPQTFPQFNRGGFTVVEWGGSELK